MSATSTFLCTLALAASFALAASGRTPQALPTPAATGGPGCTADLGRWASDAPDLTLASVVERPAGAALDGRVLPRHCEIVGSFDRHRGTDGQAYAIRFHLRLPADWNGRFFFQGGGGSDGVLGDALGDLQGGQPKTALQLGYAVVSQDAGHDNETNTVAARGGPAAFGWDERAREDYAYRSQARVTAVAKRLVTAFYGHAPAYSYWVGCSKGGQEGLAMAMRHPDYFDGVIADAPGFALPKAAVAEAWDSQVMARAARALGAYDAAGLPLINAAFSDADLGLVAKAVATACDGLDGVVDGMVGDFLACTTARVKPALAAVTCAGAKTDVCLLQAQVDALLAVYGGARDSRGRGLYSDWAWDPGVGGRIGGRVYDGWRVWKLGSAGGRRNDGLNVTLGAAALATIFTTPPTPVDAADPDASARFVLGFDFGRDGPRIFATSARYPTSPWDLMNAQSDLRGFRGRGGKMIIVQGVSDPVFSIKDTARWWNRLDAAAGGRAARSVRLFPVPGMNHCGGGPGATTFDAFGALVGWVERQRPPESLLATAPADTPWPGRTRPLCVYPAVATYRGGDVEKASSFVCRLGPRA